MCRKDIRQFIVTSYSRRGCYRYLRSWPSTQQRPVQTQAHANTYQQWRHVHTVPFYWQLIFPAGTRDFSLLHSIPTQPNSYLLGSIVMDNTAGEWSWLLIPSGLKVKNVWSRISTLSQAFTNWKKFTYPVPNITVAEQKGSTLLLLLSRKQNVKIGWNYSDTKQAWLHRRRLEVASSWQSYYTQGTRTYGGSLPMIWQETKAPSDRRLLSSSQKAACSNSE